MTRIRQTPTEKLSARLAAGREITASLKLARMKTYGHDGDEIEALALRISECIDPNNNFLATDAHNLTTGEAYDAIGTLWSCGSKLCPTCLARFASRNRKKLRAAIDAQRPRKGESYKFLTFTIPNTGLGIRATRELVNRSWQLFRKRKLCVASVRGGVKTEEFTLTKNGFHYHIHSIFLSRYLHYQEVRRVWTECVEKAFAEAQIEFVANTADSLLIVKIQPVKDHERAIHEVCKYVTKSDSWTKMRPDDLVQLALIRRWQRMFELFGSFAPRETQQSASIDGVSSETPILDTSDLSDGDQPSHEELWRDQVANYGIEAYRELLIDQITRAREARLEQIKRRWPAATIKLASEL